MIGDGVSVAGGRPVTTRRRCATPLLRAAADLPAEEMLMVRVSEGGGCVYT
jgi:hypothetical protein